MKQFERAISETRGEAPDSTTMALRGVLQSRERSEKKGDLLMRRDIGFVLGLTGLILPGFLFYGGPKYGGAVQILVNQGFFYSLIYERVLFIKRGRVIVQRLSSEWLHPEHWGGYTAFALYLASFGLVVLGLLVMRWRTRDGAFLLLVAGLATLGWMLTMYSNFRVIYGIPKEAISPIPVGALVLLGAGLAGLRE